MTEIRQLERADVDAARAVWNRAAVHDVVSPALFEEKLGGADSQAYVALDADAVVGIAVGALWPVTETVRGSVRLLAVAPGVRRRGVATGLLDAVADNLRSRGATVLRLAECAPNYLTPGVDARYASGLAFATARGFRQLGESVNLGVDLSSDDWADDRGRLDAAGVTVRRATPADEASLDRLLDSEWPTWRPEVEIALAQGTLHLAIRDGDALGFAAHGATNAEQGWFGPMGTAEAARGLGIGAVLLRRCLADLRADGHPRATIAWAAALPFYERACGATVERRFRRFERAL